MSTARAKAKVIEEVVEPEHVPPTEEEIAVRAYYRWQANGCPEGTADEDWLTAESEISATSDLMEA
jgi:hypothetical protein